MLGLNFFSSFKEKITKYIELQVKLFKINFIGKTSSLLSYFMFAMICLFIVFGILLLFALGLAESFVEAGLSRAGAYFSTLGIYVLLLVVIVLLRTKITTFFGNTFIKVLTEDEEDGDDKE